MKNNETSIALTNFTKKMSDVISIESTRPGVDKVKPKGWFKYSLQID